MRPIISTTVRAGLKGEVGGFRFGVVLMLVLGVTVSAGLKGTVGGFRFGVVLVLVLGFAVRTDATSANSGLLPLGLALDLVIGRLLDFFLLGFLIMGTPVDGVGCSPPPEKGRNSSGALICLSSSRERGGKTALMLRRVNLIGGVGSASPVRRTVGVVGGSELIAAHWSRDRLFAPDFVATPLHKARHPRACARMTQEDRIAIRELRKITAGGC
jgi:hypothetical protein